MSGQPTDTVPAGDPSLLAYFEEFKRDYELTPAWNQITVDRLEDDEFQATVDVFSVEKATGDIKILYPNLYGGAYTYDDGSQHQHKWLYRKRLRQPKGEAKYLSPKGSRMNPFFTRGLIEKYASKEVIPTLYFVEGEKKAFKGWQCGLDIVGLPSISGYVRGEANNRLHEDIEALIEGCQVQKIVFLTDADSLTVKWADGKDLSQRPAAFYAAINQFRIGCDYLMLQPNSTLKRVHWMHIDTKYCETAKGLDDLLITHAPEQAEILADLAQHNFAKKYFAGFDVSDANLVKVRAYFGLTNPEDFWKIYQTYIGFREFVYKGRCYQNTGDKVEYIKHQDAEQYMRVGDQYMKVVNIPNKHDQLEPLLRKWKSGEIARDYNKKFPSFFDEIPKYEAFCNVPANNGAYKRKHHGCYNMYEPLKHEPLRWADNYESIKHTLGFIKHLFGGSATGQHNIIGDPFTVALDYLTIMYQLPRQILPVPCLVSPENNTGKSTFLKWLRDIYGANATILGNEQFKQSFNSHYITKFIIGIDEGFIDVDKKSDKERLKKLATDDRQFLEFKGMDVQEVDFFGKIIICSNDADRLMKIEEGEIRWFVIKVPKLTSEDPHLKQKMFDEIPAWLGFLASRQISHPNESRAWFAPKYLVTDQLQRIIETTRFYHEKVIDGWIRDQFEQWSLTKLQYHAEYMLQEINRHAKYKVDNEQLKTYLKDKKGLSNAKSLNISLPTGFNEQGDLMKQKLKARAYTFLIQDWFSLDEMTEMGVQADTSPPDQETSGGFTSPIPSEKQLPF